MDNLQKKFIEALVEAEKNWISADHFIYVIYPVVKDEKLYLHVLENLYKSVVLTITSVLKFEFLHKRIGLTKDPKKNLEIFFNKCSKHYGIGEEDLILLKRVVFLGKKHKNSGFEFSRTGKIVILDDDLNTFILDSEDMKKLLVSVKKLIENVKVKFKDN